MRKLSKHIAGAIICMLSVSVVVGYLVSNMVLAVWVLGPGSVPRDDPLIQHAIFAAVIFLMFLARFIRILRHRRRFARRKGITVYEAILAYELGLHERSEFRHWRAPRIKNEIRLAQKRLTVS